MRQRTKEDSGFMGLTLWPGGRGKIKKGLKVDAHVNTNKYSYTCIYLHIADSPRL